MKAFFEGIQILFVDFLLKPFDLLRQLELKSWLIANVFNWILMIVCAYYIVYWCKQLMFHKHDNQEAQDTSAHSFLK